MVLMAIVKLVVVIGISYTTDGNNVNNITNKTMLLQIYVNISRKNI